MISLSRYLLIFAMAVPTHLPQARAAATSENSLQWFSDISTSPQSLPRSSPQSSPGNSNEFASEQISPYSTFVTNKEKSFYGLVVETGFIQDSDKAKIVADFKSDQQLFKTEDDFTIQNLEGLKSISDKSAEMLRARTILLDDKMTLVLNEDYVFSKQSQKRYAVFLISKLENEIEALDARNTIKKRFDKNDLIASHNKRGIFKFDDLLFISTAHAAAPIQIRDPLKRSELGRAKSGARNSSQNPPAPECTNIGIKNPNDIRRANETYSQFSAKQLADGCGEGAAGVIIGSGRGMLPGPDVRWYRSLGFSDKGVEESMLNAPFVLGVAGFLNSGDRALQGLFKAKRKLADWFAANQGQLRRAINLEVNNGIDYLPCLTATKRMEVICKVAAIVGAAATAKAGAGAKVTAADISATRSATSKVLDKVRDVKAERQAATKKREHLAAQQAAAKKLADIERPFFTGFNNIRSALSAFSASSGRPLKVQIQVRSGRHYDPTRQIDRFGNYREIEAGKPSRLRDPLLAFERYELNQLSSSGVRVEGLGTAPVKGAYDANYGIRTLIITTQQQAQQALTLIEKTSKKYDMQFNDGHWERHDINYDIISAEIVNN